MRETINRMWTQVREYVGKMSRGAKIRVAVLVGGIIIVGIVAGVIFSQPKWVFLTFDPDGSAHAALSVMGRDIRQTPYALEVREERLGEARALLGEVGLLGPENFNDDTLSQAAGFGVSSEHAKELYDWQTGENIRTILLQNPRIHNALVIVNSGETSPFRIQTNARRATATVNLTLTSGIMLSDIEAQSVADIVRGAVPGIEYDDIYIADQNLISYRPWEEPVVSEGTEEELSFDQRYALQNKLTEQFKLMIEQLLTPVYGRPNFTVQPSLRLNWDKTEVNKVEFAPPVAGELGGMIRSSEFMREGGRLYDEAEGIPGTDENGMGVAEYPFGEDENSLYWKELETLNYEMNETATNIQMASGVIEYLSIGVLLNSESPTGAEDLSTEIQDVVAKSLGIQNANVSVQHVPFSSIDTSVEDMIAAREDEAARERTEWIVELIAMYGTILLLGIMIMLLVRSIIRALKPPPEPVEVMIAEGPGAMDILLDDETGAADREYEDIDLNAKSAGLEQIERFIDKDAASVAQLLKNWLSDDF